jgi:hypothetical protein
LTVCDVVQAKELQFSPDENLKGKSPVSLDLVIFGHASIPPVPIHLFEKCSFKDGQNVGALHSAGTMVYMAVVAHCSVVTYPDMNVFSQLLSSCHTAY